MFVWFAAGAVAIVWTVFRSPAVDFRVVAAGSVVALLEVPFGVGPMESVVAPVMCLVLVMALTTGRRLVRRRWLGLPIGMFLHLVLDGAFTDAHAFWWPLAGTSTFTRRAFVLDRGVWSVVLELAGLAIAAWLWGEFGLSDHERRTRFVRTGQVDRSRVRRTREQGPRPRAGGGATP
ncbi:MAG: hypothetical protein R2698_00570 [Microthrixaceae bacterium]